MAISEISEKHTKDRVSTNYLPAVLKEYKSRWVIEYYVEHPIEQRMVRKTIKVNRILSRYGSKIKARAHINKMVNNINIKLAGGWNPLFHSEDARLYTLLTDVFDIYINEKKKELRKNSMISYIDFGNTFIPYIKKISPDMYASMITRLMCVKWIDELYIERNFGVCRYNNFIKAGRAFFNWAKEKCYVKDNPFDTIKLKQKHQKQREIIPKETREKIVEYLNKHNSNVTVLLKLIYNSLLRPNEIRLLKINYIDKNNKCIIIPSNVAKNGKQRIVYLTEDLSNDLNSMNLQQYPNEYYLFSIDFKPGKNKVGGHYYSAYWAKIREKIGLPKTMQLYSLRDTGIFDMLKAGIDDLSVMQHADHSSLDMTTIYANHADPHLGEIIREKSPIF